MADYRAMAEKVQDEARTSYVRKKVSTQRKNNGGGGTSKEHRKPPEGALID